MLRSNLKFKSLKSIILSFTGFYPYFLHYLRDLNTKKIFLNIIRCQIPPYYFVPLNARLPLV